MIVADELIDQIESHLRERRISASAFGRAAIGDPNLVGDLRAGRMPNLRTVRRLTEYMNSACGDASAHGPAVGMAC